MSWRVLPLVFALETFRCRFDTRPPARSNWRSSPLVAAELALGIFRKIRSVSNLKWLDGYSGEAVDELIGLAATHRIDSIVVAFEQAMDQKSARVGMERLSLEERVILAIEALERAVNNDGFNSIFITSVREHVPIMVDALLRTGCPKTAEITKRAIEIEQKNPFIEEHGAWVENEGRDAAVNECDRLYYQCPENIEESLFAFIKANRNKINP